MGWDGEKVGRARGALLKYNNKEENGGISIHRAPPSPRPAPTALS